jgi:hypothetical protein
LLQERIMIMFTRIQMELYGMLEYLKNLKVKKDKSQESKNNK